jgi:hypothetical protein
MKIIRRFFALTMHKKAQVAEGLLVFMVLFLLGLALFKIQVFDPKIEKSISYSSVIEEVYAREESAKYQLKAIAEKSAFESYVQELKSLDVANSNNPYISVYDIKGKNYLDKFKESIISSIESKSFDSNSEMVLLQKNIRSSLIVKEDIDVLYLELNNRSNFVIDMKKKDSMGQDIEINYKPGLYIEVNLTRMGLVSLDELSKISYSCYNEQNYLNCMSIKLPLYEVSKNTELFTEGSKIKLSGNIAPKNVIDIRSRKNLDNTRISFTLLS